MKRDARLGGVRVFMKRTSGALHLFWHQTSLVQNVMLEFRAEMLKEAHHWERSGIAECTDRPTADIAANRSEHIQIFHFSLASFDTVDDLIQPVRALTARCALTT